MTDDSLGLEMAVQDVQKGRKKGTRWEGLLCSVFKGSRARLVSVVLRLEDSRRTVVWTKPGFLVPKSI